MKKAWYFFCPIYFNIETYEVEYRNRFGHILWPMAYAYHWCAVRVLSLFGYDTIDEFPIKITGDKK